MLSWTASKSAFSRFLSYSSIHKGNDILQWYSRFVGNSIMGQIFHFEIWYSTTDVLPYCISWQTVCMYTVAFNCKRFEFSFPQLSIVVIIFNIFSIAWPLWKYLFRWLECNLSLQILNSVMGHISETNGQISHHSEWTYHHRWGMLCMLFMPLVHNWLSNIFL